MAVISLSEISIAFGGDPLLDRVTLHIERGERACLIGRNGCGKSTLLRLLAGEIKPDSGEIIKEPEIKTAYLPQEIPEELSGTVKAVVESGAPRHVHAEHWEHEHVANQAMTRLGLTPDVLFETLSGGMKRRALLAKALVCEPDVLLLDEPTNHLDIAAIEWLEGFLLRQNCSLLFVTHDRAFLRRLATRILNLDRGTLAGWNCSYDVFLQHKQQLIEDEEAMWKKTGKRLSKEEIWIRKGIKARRTRNEGRVRALLALREKFRKRRLETGVSRIQLQSAGTSGSLAVKAENVNFAYAGQPPVIRNLNLRILRGERIGVIGPNGVGKTTFLRLITGKLQPHTGTITLGARLKIAYFDQLRATLDSEQSVVHNLAGDKDTIEVNGRQRHVYGYLQDFLFEPERARTPVKVLSGGERNRLLLAMLFMHPGNMLIMDEPTNDLDIETLDLLEEQLQQNEHTLLLVSHDREFLNNIVTSTLVFEGDGLVKTYAGGYDDMLVQRQACKPASHPVSRKPAARTESKSKNNRLTNKERHELEHMDSRVQALEKEQAALIADQSNADFYKRPAGEIAAAAARLEEVSREIDQLLERWMKLEKKKK